MADATHTLNLSRRKVFAGASLLVAPVASVALVDPALIAIEAHRTAAAVSADHGIRTDCVRAAREGREISRSEMAAAQDAAQAEVEAMGSLLRTAPQTVAGMRAQIEYVAGELSSGQDFDVADYFAAMLASPVLST